MAEAPPVRDGVSGPGGAATRPAGWDWNRILTPRVVLLIVPVAALVAAAYLYPLMRWEAVWRKSPAWSHGYLIPLIAILLAHFRLTERLPTRFEPCIWGLGLIVVAGVLRVWSQTLKVAYPAEVTLLLFVAGVVLLLLGRQMLRVLWVPIAYLGLMIPWDTRYYERVALPLQTLGAAVTEQIVNLLGFGVMREGNVLTLASGPLTVAEACSGLHLLFAFVALGVMMAYIYKRPLWERILIMASSVPIAVLCNIIRVTLMAVASDTLHFAREHVLRGEDTWARALPAAFWKYASGAGDLPAQLTALRDNVLNPDSTLHQSFGFAMMALAFLLMWSELRAIDMFFIEEDE